LGKCGERFWVYDVYRCVHEVPRNRVGGVNYFV